MERHRQSFDEIIANLSSIQAEWKDDLALTTMALLSEVEEKTSYTAEDLRRILTKDFDAGLTLVRLFLDLPKDEFLVLFRAAAGGRGTGVKAFRADPESFLASLSALGTMDKMREVTGAPTTWRDLLVERLKSGRGSAVKAQTRGKFLEDRTEDIVRNVFGPGHYDLRCRFIGSTGTHDEKADFAIPTKEDPRILIEVKAYGATGSKQTDILGDMGRIIEKKRHDTTLLFVTDGVTWTSRANDLRRLIELQNQGKIARIYTSKMFPELQDDLMRLRAEYGLASTP